MTHSPTQTLASSAYFESQTCKLARMGATNSAKKACKYEKAIPDEFCTLYLWVWICKLLNTTLAGFSFRFLKHWLWFKYSLMICQCDPERNIYPSTPQLFPIYHLLVDLGRISFSIHILTAALLLFRPSTTHLPFPNKMWPQLAHRPHSKDSCVLTYKYFPLSLSLSIIQPVKNKNYVLRWSGNEKLRIFILCHFIKPLTILDFIYICWYF